MDNDIDNTYYKMIQGAKDNAISYLKHFYELLNLDPNLLNFMSNVNLDIKPLLNNSCAEYWSDTNTIIVNTNYIDNLISSIYDDFDNPYVVEKSKQDLELTMVHELIHSNRVVLKTNGLNFDNIDKNKELEKKKNIDGHDFFQYRLLLSDVLDKPYVFLFDRYIPFKINLSNNTVIAYDRDDKKYLVLKDQFLNIDIKRDEDSIIKEIGVKLNDNFNDYEIEDEIDLLIDDNNTVYEACCYYSPFDKYGKLVFNSDIDDNESFKEILDKKYVTAHDYMKHNTRGLEEYITETIARIVIHSKNDDKLDYDKVFDLMDNDNCARGIKIMIEIIRNSDNIIVKWFMTSAYSEYYYDLLEDLLKEKYLPFLDYMAYLYDVDYNNHSVDDVNGDCLVRKLKK